MGINKLDTVKDKEGKRFRVADMYTSDGQIVAVLKGIHPDGSPRRGGARQVLADVLEAEYTRIDLPPVTIRKIDDLSEEEKPVVKEPTPSEKAAQIEAQAVRELSKKDIEKAVEASTFGGSKKPQETNGAYIHRVNKEISAAVKEAKEHEAKERSQDIEILKAEILDLKGENRRLRAAIEEKKMDNAKTISKMQQAHQAEVEDLKDQLSEAQALANAANKYKDEVVREKSQYSAALDDDSVAFEEILVLAEIMQLQSKGMVKLAKQIAEKTEGRI